VVAVLSLNLGIEDDRVSYDATKARCRRLRNHRTTFFVGGPIAMMLV
jgi:hypothetical protein